ncbi:MAG: DUF6061 family protein [Lachnospiraceae bacterium]|nr:DUF6061 family protein [Lachnospiraceae bacterium]
MAKKESQEIKPKKGLPRLIELAMTQKASIYTPGVDDEICPTVPMQTEIDWLIYNEPLTYARLVFSGELEQYARDMAGTHGMID